MQHEVYPSPNFEQWAFFKTADGVWYEARYIVTQFEDEGPEYVETRQFWNGSGPTPTWHRPTDEELGEDLVNGLDAFFFGKAEIAKPVKMLPSTISDIEATDRAVKHLGETSCQTDEAWKLAEPIFDALADARNGLIYLNSKLPEDTPNLIDWKDASG